MIKIRNTDGDEVRLYKNEGAQMDGYSRATPRKLRSLSRAQIATVFRVKGWYVMVEFLRPSDIVAHKPGTFRAEARYTPGRIYFGCQEFVGENVTKMRRWALGGTNGKSKQNRRSRTKGR